MNANEKRKNTKVAKFFLSVLVLTLFGFTKVSHSTQALDKLIEGAKKEGKVAYYVSMNTRDASLMANAFQKKYPFLKVEIFRSSGEKLLVRALAEARAKKLRADIFDSSIIQVSQMKQNGLLMKYFDPESEAIPEKFKDPGGFWTATYILPYVITYNTRMISAQNTPKTYYDLLDPKWKGKIGIDTEEIQWFFYMLKIMGREKGIKFMKDLAQQDLMMRKGHTLLVTLCVAGELPIVVVGYLSNVRAAISKGAPIDWVRFESFPVITAIHAISIVSNAPHPNSAKLFYNFSISRDGAKVFKQMKRNPIRPEEQDPEVRKLNTYMAIPDELLANYDQVVKEWEEIFRK